MNRRDFIGASVGAALAACSSSAATAEERPPNVIILLVDEMGYGDMGAHGNPIIKTPNFDRLHDQSARFTNFAVSPSCSPTRAALLTGKHEFLSGVTHTIKPMRQMSLKSTTIADLFKKRGYRTGIFGKWHLELAGPYNPARRGFDDTLTCVDDDYKRSHFNPTLVRNGIQRKYDGYRTDIFFSEAIRFIEQNKGNPFFLYLATHSPHSPHNVPARYSKPYEAFRERYQGKRYGPGFFGMVANVDENLGRLMARLTELGLDGNTLLIVMNDNGGTGGVDVFNAGRRGVKGTIWSGGTRAYSFWKWGDRSPAGARSQMSGHVDVLPTLADLCGLPIPRDLRAQIEGGSLRPVLEDPEGELDEDRMQVHHVGRWTSPKHWADHKYANSCVRWKQYTLVRIEPCEDKECRTCFAVRNRIPRGEAKLSYTTDPEHHRITTPGRWELYDIHADPFQKADIAAKHPDIVKTMSDHYEAWWMKVESTLAPDAAETPSIIFIMADDLGYGDLGCYGAEKIRTPNVDALAASGIRFTDAHSPSSVCTPTRYAVLTGRYAWRGRLKHGVQWSGYDRLLIEQGRKTIGNMLQEKGYRTAQIGKWHPGWGDEEPVDYSTGRLGRGPKELGFDYSFVTAAAQNMSPLVFVENHTTTSKLKPMDYYVYDPEQKEIPQKYLDWYARNAKGPQVVAADWEPYRVDEIYTEKAVAFIKDHHARNPEQPFYLHLTTETPHKPNTMPKRFCGSSQAGARGDHVQMLDWVVGEVVSVVSELGIRRNTLIIVTSDNGAIADTEGRRLGHKSNGDLHGSKRWLDEGGHRVPLVATWPARIPAGKVSDTLICLTDMMATFAAITGYRLSSDMGEDSFNALPALLGSDEPIRASIIHHDIRGNLGIRKGPWKLLMGRQYGGVRLYNIGQDVLETTDVAAQHPEIVAELKALIAKQRADGRTATRAE